MMDTKLFELRDVPGFLGYEVDENGTVYSRMTRGRSPFIGQTSHQLKPWLNDGYLVVALGRKKRFRVHQLVALAFIGPCPKGQEVRHFDGDKKHNHYTNLSYGTRQQNCLDTVRHGRFNLKLRFGEQHPRHLLTLDQVNQIKRRLEVGEKQSAIANVFGVSASTVYLIKKGKIWRRWRKDNPLCQK
jgi:hypothetical protein